MAHSKIYVPCKALGHVSNHIPVVTRYIDRRKENLIVTCVGKSFHTYGTSHFTLLSVSGLHEEEITCIAADRFLIFTAAGCRAFAWRRGVEMKHEYKGHQHPIHIMLTFGPHLITVDELSFLKVWNIKTEEKQIELDFSNSVFEITALMHPVTYLNKILLGSEQGSLQLWNLKTSKLIYTFKGWSSGVNVIEQTPAVNVVGIGLKNGYIMLHNLKFDEVVMEFEQDWGIVTNLTFRMDDQPIMISGTNQGHLIMWNLDEQKVFSQVLHAHDGAVTGLQCLPYEPLMVSSSPDNSLKLWIFDLSDGGARMLRVREGHSLPPTYIRYHGANGHNIITSGGDSSLRIFNTVTDTFNKSLGKASYNRKISKKRGRAVEDPLRMPPITKFTSESTREKEWDNIAALHLGIPQVTTWSYDKLKMGDLKLIHERFKNKSKSETRVRATPVCICLTHCGNFVVIGYSSGHCDRFNIQSGMYRGSYGSPIAHDGAVRGVSTDTLNQVVVTGGSDKLVKWWSFKGLSPDNNETTVLELEDGVAFFTSQSDSSLIAIALEDFSIVIVDNDSRNVIRTFSGHCGRLTDAAFSPDARWLVTAAMDACVCTWDVPSGCLVDVFKVDAACTSLTFSPTGEMLATTHVDDLGVFLWVNRCLFNHVSLKPVLMQRPEHLPVTSFLDTPRLVDTDVDDVNEEYQSVEQIDAALITMSGFANSRWQNLLNMDLVKKRNKPIEPPKAPKSAPFFLPTVPSLDITFDIPASGPSDSPSSVPKHLQGFTVFSRSLLESTTDFTKAIEKIKCFGPTAIDFEINSLSLDEEHTARLLLHFIKMIEAMLRSNRDFELAQAYLGLFLKVHGDAISQSEELTECLQTLLTSHLAVWDRIQGTLFYNMAVVQGLKNL